MISISTAVERGFPPFISRKMVSNYVYLNQERLTDQTCYICYEGFSIEGGEAVAHDNRHILHKKCLIIFLNTKVALETNCVFCGQMTDPLSILTDFEKDQLQKAQELRRQELRVTHILLDDRDRLQIQQERLISAINDVSYNYLPRIGAISAGIAGGYAAGPFGGIAGAAAGAVFGNFIHRSLQPIVAETTKLTTQGLSHLTGIREYKIASILETGVTIFSLILTVNILYELVYTPRHTDQLIQELFVFQNSQKIGQFIGGISGGVIGCQYRLNANTSDVLNRVYQEMKDPVKSVSLLASIFIGALYGATVTNIYLEIGKR